jgi:hypothetical protein
VSKQAKQVLEALENVLHGDLWQFKLSDISFDKSTLSLDKIYPELKKEKGGFIICRINSFGDQGQLGCA